MEKTRLSLEFRVFLLCNSIFYPFSKYNNTTTSSFINGNLFLDHIHFHYLYRLKGGPVKQNRSDRRTDHDATVPVRSNDAASE